MTSLRLGKTETELKAALDALPNEIYNAIDQDDVDAIRADIASKEGG